MRSIHDIISARITSPIFRPASSRGLRIWYQSSDFDSEKKGCTSSCSSKHAAETDPKWNVNHHPQRENVYDQHAVGPGNRLYVLGRLRRRPQEEQPQKGMKEKAHAQWCEQSSPPSITAHKKCTQPTQNVKPGLTCIQQQITCSLTTIVLQSCCGIVPSSRLFLKRRRKPRVSAGLFAKLRSS